MSPKNLSLEGQIDALQRLSRTQLVGQWTKFYKCSSPKGVKRGLLERAIVYHIQRRRVGGLKSETRRSLLAIANGVDAAFEMKVGSSSSLKPGARLVREWHGKPYQVNVTESGFEWDGNEYASLSAIAKAITGAKWSGPRFFGL